MLFDDVALLNKTRYLDLALDQLATVRAVVARHVSGPARVERLSRIWEPGGGATLFRIDCVGQRYLLKVKHRDVWVESRLESEPAFMRKPSLANEHEFFRRLPYPWVPRVFFFDEVGALQFLATEWLEPFHRASEGLTVPQLLRAWDDLADAIRTLFDLGIVHTDVHEYNLCFRGDQIVLVDFEEARTLKQDVSFDMSLDVVGVNAYGSVGQFSEAPGAVPGLTCLNRMRTVFQWRVRERLPDMLAESAFGRECPFNLDELQEADGRPYQSLSFDGLNITGHRPLRDARVRLLAVLFRMLARNVGPIAHLDVGCNLGVFCLRLGALSEVRRSIGVDAAEPYVAVARALAFLHGNGKVEFHRKVCGADSLADAFQGIDVVTMLSVYHHIRDKERFLADVTRLSPQYLVAEFATQDRFYPELGSLASEIQRIQAATGLACAQEVAVSHDYGRPIVVFSNTPLGRLTLWACWAAMKNVSASCRRRAAGLRQRLGRLRRRALPWGHMRTTLVRRFRGTRGSAPMRALAWARAQELASGGLRVHPAHPTAYPEVTGYFVPTLLGYGDKDLARRCVRWLIRIQQPDGAFTDPDHGRPHVFDTAQALRGLLAGIDLADGARDAAQRAAEYLCRQALSEGAGGFAEAYRDVPHAPESIHLYALPPLRAAAEALGLPRYRQIADRCLEFYVRHDSALNIDASLTHFLAYELEALIDLGRSELAAPVLSTLEELQRSDGAVRGIGGADWICTPGLVQLALCWYKIGRPVPADRAMQWIEAHQEASGAFRGSYGSGAWYFPDDEPAWTVKYYLEANRWRVRSFFDRSAPLFPSDVSATDGRLQMLLSVVRAGDRVLEVGCGKGRFLKAIAAARPDADCTGVDVSPELLRHVPPPVRTMLGSLENIPLPDHEFDVVFSVEAIEHSANRPAAVAELIRVARPGGWIVIIDKQRTHWGRLDCSPWEDWPDAKELVARLGRACSEVEAIPVAYDDHPASDGLMVAWRGRTLASFDRSPERRDA